MPQRALPPQTSKKARRAYLKSQQHHLFTPTQYRAAERRDQLEKRAKDIAAKEERKAVNKRKREEKEATEREAKRQRIAEGRLPPEAALGKVTASQPRLNLFFANPKPPTLEVGQESKDEAFNNLGHDCGGNSVREPPMAIARDILADAEDLANFFSAASQPSTSTVGGRIADDAEATILEEEDNSHNDSDDNHQDLNLSPGAEQVLLDAQLSFSEIDFDFDILEDDDADPEIDSLNLHTNNQQTNDVDPGCHLSATPKKRKADAAGIESISPAKSARSALSNMSPSKVNIRAQEKPDALSVAPFAASLPSPPTKRPGIQSAADVIAMISTQDLDDDEILTDKENQDPFSSVSRVSAKDLRCKSHGMSPAITSKASGKFKQAFASDKHRDVCASINEDICDHSHDLWDSDLENDEHEDDFDNDLDVATLAALIANSPSKRKASSATNSMTTTSRGNAWKMREAPAGVMDATVTAINKSMPSPPIHAKPEAASMSSHDLPLATQGNSFSFDGIQDEDLRFLAERYDSDGVSSSEQLGDTKKLSRTIPWNHASQSSIPQHSAEPLSQDDDGYDYI